MRCGILADDLTGACDAGVQFARHGLKTVVWLDDSALPDADVVVLSTATRRDSPATAQAKVARACERLAQTGHELIYKKIDSTLRGNVAAEIEACGAVEAWVTPAYPALGRQFIHGQLFIKGAPQRVRLESQPGLRVFDAVTQEDLEAVARHAFAEPQRPLLAGSAGLAIEVAKALGCPEARDPAILGRRGPAVLYIGSTHAATVAQVASLRGSRDPHTYRIVPVRSLDGEVGPPVARYQARDAAGLIVTGGDTAALVCRVLKVRGIRLIREILPGIPYGRLLGGRFDGVPVITKAGGFGAENTLSVLVDALRGGLR
ncbi:MAG TPA: four-carbon acid sugar kinase family protein [Bryobacteraceae bacterium]|nr:four-carbon acid sugar kinase family protein [Bryobacteraceae bacterium]